ncbi:MAG: DUF2314 domain-containing protein [Verrucomicrobiales bacterium]|nr:DUF2314 domain-containing protein [Verrucomicrobiae bacterium]MCP5554815.1 DUF2314 domain-containing protein [Akkermansiaceae bacterium]HRX53062.1 DUF2314 domain-containing protein [Verrucomicrobiales bacterium]
MWASLRKLPWLPLALFGFLFARLLSTGLSPLGTALFVTVLLWLGWAVACTLQDWLRPSRAARKHAAAGRTGATPKPFVSLVFFLDEARNASLESVKKCVATALIDEPADSPVEIEEVSARRMGPSLAEQTQQFLVRLNQGIFGIILSPHPYIESPAQFAKETIRDKRLRSAIERHQAWISVDLMAAVSNPAARRAAYQVISRLMAALAGPDCLALFCPELQRCNEFDPTLLERLNSPDPLSIFDEPTFEPVIEVSADDPRLREAVKEALLRWPEFVTAFRTRTPDDDRFIAKAEFTENGISEFMWVSVTQAGDRGLRGILLNDPHEILRIHKGASVTVDLSRLNDWIYPDADGNPVGGFTLSILSSEEPPPSVED